MKTIEELRFHLKMTSRGVYDLNTGLKHSAESTINYKYSDEALTELGELRDKLEKTGMLLKEYTKNHPKLAGIKDTKIGVHFIDPCECPLCNAPKDIEDEKIKDEIIYELHKAIKKLGGMSDILCISGAYGDTMDADETLTELKTWNALEEQGAYGELKKHLSWQLNHIHLDYTKHPNKNDELVRLITLINTI